MGPLRPRPFRNPGLAVLAMLAMGIGIGAFGTSREASGHIVAVFLGAGAD